MNNIISSLKSLGSLEKARILQRFFKTGSGEYGQGSGLALGVFMQQGRKEPFHD